MSIASTAAIFGSPDSEEKSMATVADLREELDAADIEYPAKATKAELEALLPKEPEAAVCNEVRNDIKITCMVETMDGEVHEQEFLITNPRGCIPGAYVNKPDTVYQILRAGLVKKLGTKHIK